MTSRGWLWAGTVIDIILFVVALFYAGLTLAVVGMSASEPAVIVLIVMALLWPCLCLFCPPRAWRYFGREQLGKATILIVLPVAHGLVLVVLLNFLG